MGKRRQKKKQNGPNRKRQKRTERYWIQDCPDLTADDDARPVNKLLLWLSRADLEDDHHSKTLEKNQNDEPVPLKLPLASTKPSGATRSDTGFGAELPTIYIQRGPETSSPTVHINKSYVPLPKGDCGDGIINPYETVPDKFWAQRKRLFTKFDSGIQLDADGWFSVTPEAIAQHIASRMVSKGANLIVLDAFCGVGGNAIAFAARPETAKVVCVDTCLERLKMAAHNCAIYNIPAEKLLFIHGDACDVLTKYVDGNRIGNKSNEGKSPTRDEKSTTRDDYEISSDYDLLPHKLDSIFLSPPWGGVAYEEIGPRHYNLSHIQLNDRNAVDGVELLRRSAAALPAAKLNIGYFLPRNLNGLMFAQNCADCGITGCVELEQNVLNRKLKTITAYVQSNYY